MNGWLTAPELWIGLSVFGGIAYLLRTRDRHHKQLEARIARVSRKSGNAALAKPSLSLRRRQPEHNAIGQFLQQFSSVEKLQSRLKLAGMVMRPQQFLLTALGIGVGVFLVVLLLGKPAMLALLVGLAAGLGLPHMKVSRNIKKRKQTFLKLFPEGIDLIVRGLRAGLPVGEAFQNIAKEIPVPVGNTFSEISQQIALGMPMDKALSDMADKLDMTEFNFFVTTIILQRETGGNLSEILSNLSEVLRQRQMMKLKIGALSSEARASAYIVGSLPFVVFLLLTFISPHYLDPLYNDFRGNLSLLGAFCSMTLGGFIMKKMTELEI
jgi:tight adherence protein B